MFAGTLEILTSILHQRNTEDFVLNNLNGERDADRFAQNVKIGEWNTERFGLNGSNGKRLERYVGTVWSEF
jgi:hypothetical protein